MDQPEMQIVQMLMERIWCDTDFNCRGPISPMDVADLAQSIRNKGLQFPITVQPGEDVVSVMPEGKDHRIVAGHRRYTAAKVLGWTSIPVIVKKGLDEKAARVLNLIENFQREDLNILQEAMALKHLHEAGVPRDHVAKEVGKSSGWVQVRFNLLSLPVEIQQEAAAGILNQFQIKSLCSLKSPDDQYAAVRKIKEAKLRGEKPQAIAPRKKKTSSVAKARVPNEIYDMVEIVAKTKLGYGIHTRVLAWAAGSISSAELFQDIQVCDPDFRPPMEF